MASIVRQGLMSAVRMAAAAVVLLCALAAWAPSADAAIPSVFTNTATPVPCAVQSDGVRALLGSRAQHREDLRRRPDRRGRRVPATAGERPRRALPADHACSTAMRAGQAFGCASMQPWLDRGYATFTMTTRGFGESCGTAAARAADPAGLRERVRALHRTRATRFATRRSLRGCWPTSAASFRRQIGAIGGSYGGAMSMSLARAQGPQDAAGRLAGSLAEPVRERRCGSPRRRRRSRGRT